MATKKERWNDANKLEQDLAIDVTAQISAVNAGGTEYTLADGIARQGVIDNRARIDDIKDIIAGGVNFRGKTTVELTDGATTKSISMAGGSTLVVEDDVAGDMVIVPQSITGAEDREFIWDGAKWNEFGTASQLKSFAFADTGSVTITPKGSLSVTAAGAQDATVTGTFETTANVDPTVNYEAKSYTPEGTVSTSYKPAGDVTVQDVVISDKTITVNEITGASFAQNNISVQAAFTGSEITADVDVTSKSGNVTFSGTISEKTLTATGTVHAVTDITTGSTDVMNTAVVTNGVLSFGTTAVLSSAAKVDNDVNLDNGSAVFTATEITTSGNALTAVEVSATATPTGTVTTQQFNVSGNVSLLSTNVDKTVAGQTIELTAGFVGTTATISADLDGTPKAPEISVDIVPFGVTGSITGSAAVSADTITGTFAGTTEPYTVNPVTT